MRKKPKLDQLQILLRDPKSALTTMDISVRDLGADLFKIQDMLEFINVIVTYY